MNSEAAAETAALIANLWQRQLPTLHERLDTLDRIAASSAHGSISAEDRQEGIAISHKFAGSLGMYGYARGSQVASEMETFLRSDEAFDPGVLLSLTFQLRESIFPTLSA
ncbi:MAG: Hpt domain protein [Acidobacteriaceae bacterium]|nr:Hpt domain protein [Acidobacteriaceae bacterium]